MNYTLMPSLELQALIKTAITLWNQDYIRTITTNSFKISFIGERQEDWQQVEDMIIEKVQELPLPESLKKKVLGIIKPIGFEILKYKSTYRNIDSRLVRENLNKLSWTPKGTVDRKKTAEAFIRDESLGIEKRYGLACTYCFENDILMLRNKMPEYLMEEVEPIQHELVIFWTYDMKGEVTMINNVIAIRWPEITSYQHAFEFAAGDGNKVATEYFFQKLTSEEKEESLVRYAGYACRSGCYNQYSVSVKDYAGVLCFLLSQMNEEQQVQLFKKHHYQVLRCFLLYWPCQGFFIKTAKRMWTFLARKDYYLLLGVIVNKVLDGYKDYNYHKLFREFWQLSPTTHKQYAIKIFHHGSLLKKLLLAKNKENIKLILKDATTSEREKIISWGNGACALLIYKDEMDLLEFFVQECLSSKDIMIKFREEYKRKCNLSEGKQEEKRYMCSKFYQLINNFIGKDGKRGLEEGNSGPAKRVCSLTDE